MNPFTHRTTGMEQNNRSLQPMHGADTPSSRRQKRAMLVLASLVGIVGSGALFTDIQAQSSHVDPETEDSQSSSPALPNGAELYGTCSTCHQANGGGVPGVFPPLTETEWVTGDEEVLIRIVLNGMTGEIEVNGILYASAMPPWGGFLADEEIAALLSYIRTEWGNDASEVAPETVAEVREAVADRTAPWTGAELEAIREANEKAKAEAAQAKATEETTAKTTAEEEGEK